MLQYVIRGNKVGLIRAQKAFQDFIIVGVVFGSDKRSDRERP